MRAKLIYISLAIFWNITIVFFFSLQTRVPDLPSIDELNNFVLQKKDTPFSSVLIRAKSYGISTPGYPFVSTSPATKKHLLIIAKENREEHQEPLFYAQKRVSEIISFQHTMKRDDWRIQLGRYEGYVSQQLQRIENASSDFVKITMYAELNTYLTHHQQDILDILATRPNPFMPAEELKKMVLESFASISQKIPSKIIANRSLFYYPQDISTQKKYGKYTIEVSTLATQAAELKDISLYINNQKIPYTILFHNRLALRSTNDINFSSPDSRLEITSSKSVSDLLKLKPSVIATKAPNQKETTFTLGLDKSNFPNKRILVLKHFSNQEIENTMSAIGIAWKAKIASSYLSNLEETRIELTYWPAEIAATLIKIMLLIELAFILFIIAMRKKIFKNTTLQFHFLNLLRSNLAKDLEKFKIGIRRYRMFIMAFLVIGLLFDILIFSPFHSIFVILIISLLFIFLSLIYSFSERECFAVSLFFFLFSPLALILRQELIVEKIGQWSLLFLFFGTFLLFIKSTFKTSLNPNHLLFSSLRNEIYSKFFNLFNSLLFKPLLRILHLVIRYKRLILFTLIIILLVLCVIELIPQVAFYRKYYPFSPEREFFLRTGLPQLVTVLVFCSLAQIFLKKRIKIFEEIILVILFFTWISLSIVFKMTSFHLRTFTVITGISQPRARMWDEVTIYGKNFGVAQYNGAGVYIDNSPQRILLWTDDKIVFVVDAHDSDTGQLWVRNVDQKKSNKLLFEYQPL